MRRILVVGGSLAGHHAAQTLRNLGFDGDVTVLGEEPHRPYERYPLSKAYLLQEMNRSGLDIGPCADDEVHWRLGEAARRLDLASREVVLDNGDRVGFDGLVVASGARARTPVSTTDVEETFTLRTVEDAVKIRCALSSQPRRVAVVGAGLIGAEIASAAVDMGHDVTLVASEPVPTHRRFGRLVSTHVQRARVAAGVRVVVRSRARGIGRDARGTCGVLLHDGRWLAAEVVILATGTLPNTEWLQGSGLDATGGLLCEPTLHAAGTSFVVGAGDVVRVPHPLLGNQPVRMEHWASARAQAALAATNLLAGPDGADRLQSLPTFGTTLHGIEIRVVGFPAVADHDELLSGSLESGSAVVGLRRRGRLVAGVAVNRAASTEGLTEMVQNPESWRGSTVLPGGVER